MGWAIAIHLGRPLPGASCDLPGQRRRNSLAIPGFHQNGCRPYLVLLPVGFTLPPMLPSVRCALTAPFHPYPQKPINNRKCGRFAFCGTFPGVAPAGGYPAPCFHGARTFLPPSLKIQRATIRSSGRTEYTTINYRKIEANQLAIHVIKSVTAVVVLLWLYE